MSSGKGGSLVNCEEVHRIYSWDKSLDHAGSGGPSSMRGWPTMQDVQLVC